MIDNLAKIYLKNAIRMVQKQSTTTLTRAEVLALMGVTPRHIHEANAALREAGSDGWQLIETAPRAAQLILGNSEQRWIRFGRFYPEFRKWYYSGTNERQQYSETQGGVPTHWRPLPTPPRSGDAQ